MLLSERRQQRQEREAGRDQSPGSPLGRAGRRSGGTRRSQRGDQMTPRCLTRLTIRGLETKGDLDDEVVPDVSAYGVLTRSGSEAG